MDTISEQKILAVVVTYNRKQLLLECIDHLLHQTIGQNIKILIIDNASSDGTYQVLKPYIDKNFITYINTGSNLGGAGGFEYGVRQASKENCDYVWLMDDDSMPEPNAAEYLLEYALKIHKFGFLSSYVKWVDGSPCVMNLQRKDIMQKITSFDKKVIKIEIATFVSMFIPMKVIYEFGAPIGEFFIWGDDWEYTRRISKQLPCYLITQSVVVHKTKFNRGSDIALDSFDRMDRYRYSFRNNYYLTHRDGLKGRAYWCLLLAKNAIKIIVISKDHKKERLNTMIEGAKEGKQFNPILKPVDNK